MIFTARQLEQLYKASGRIVLPYRARLSPLARDWARAKKITVGYADVADPIGEANDSRATAPALPFHWWCDGPSGIAKAALTMAAKESPLAEAVILEDASRVFAAARYFSRAIKSETIAGGIVITKFAGEALLYLNRSPAIRATIGSSLATVEDAIRTFAANVLVIEQDRHPLVQLRSMATRFAKAPRTLDARVANELKELAS